MAVIVLDVGKTVSKLTMWERDGTLIERSVRLNDCISTDSYVSLDAKGIEGWLESTLRDFSSRAKIEAIIPVAHGAGFAIIRDGELACLPMDYELSIPEKVRKEYNELRDGFLETGTPSLPDGLNLGAQIYYLECLRPGILSEGSTILPWAQYWSWLLSGVPASEITSMGCHTDLWHPLKCEPSRLSVIRGWSKYFAPLEKAGEILGNITDDWVERTGLPVDVDIYCGLHDSNAALVAARGFPEIAESESTVLSTGTWFVAMRTLPDNEITNVENLSESRDCLINVDVEGRATPSARFMGGREVEKIIDIDREQIEEALNRPDLVNYVADIVSTNTMLLPTFAKGNGPFPFANGHWVNKPENIDQQLAAVSLYLALISDASLALIGAKEKILIEGRFANADCFTRLLATFRQETKIYVSHVESDVSYGALRLINSDLQPSESLSEVQPLSSDLNSYRAQWHEAVGRESN